MNRILCPPKNPFLNTEFILVFGTVKFDNYSNDFVCIFHSMLFSSIPTRDSMSNLEVTAVPTLDVVLLFFCYCQHQQLYKSCHAHHASRGEPNLLCLILPSFFYYRYFMGCGEFILWYCWY
jgi:hypothetical protein